MPRHNSAVNRGRESEKQSRCTGAKKNVVPPGHQAKMKMPFFKIHLPSTRISEEIRAAAASLPATAHPDRFGAVNRFGCRIRLPGMGKERTGNGRSLAACVVILDIQIG